MDIAEVIKRAGGASALGRLIGRHHTTILEWQAVPAKHVPAVSRITGIPRHVLAPELYEAPVSAPEQAAA